MKEFLNILRRFVPPYKKYLVLSVVFNILSAVLNIFSFAALIPILQILFQTSDAEAATSLMAWDWGNVQEVLMNNGRLLPGSGKHPAYPDRRGARHAQPTLP